jgi:hypothetical protein
MFQFAKKKIQNSKLNIEPFPYIFIKNFNKKSFNIQLNKVLPNFDDLNNSDVMFQSKSHTKKTLLPSSSIYKEVNKKKNINNLNNLFKKLKPVIIKKFKDEIKKYVNKQFRNSKLIYHSSYSVMKKGYLKSAHLDRRDHLIHIIYYSTSDVNKGGEICIQKLKQKKKQFDVFPETKSIRTFKKYKILPNSCLIILNVPWAYHSVKKYIGNKDRKYFYMVYDFPIKNTGSNAKNRKKGFNGNIFWKQKVKVQSSKRRNVFLTE